MTTLFSHPRQPRRTAAPARRAIPQNDHTERHGARPGSVVIPAAPTRPSPASGALQRPTTATSTIPTDAVPSFIPPRPSTLERPTPADVELRPPAASWEAIASTSRQLRRSESTTIPSDIATLGWRGRAVTRTFDLVAATLLIVVTLPLMVLIAVAVALTSRGPVLHVSWRIGRGGNVFACCKFRTMHRDAEAQLPHMLAADPRLAAEYRVAHSLRHDTRVTHVGRLLRRTHLDELPQLCNVLTGRMSLVGPRPITPAEMGLYGPALAQVLTVKPGITGAWQVSKRLGGYAGRIESDLAYLDRRHLGVDVWIVVRTVLLVIGIGRRPQPR